MKTKNQIFNCVNDNINIEKNWYTELEYLELQNHLHNIKYLSNQLNNNKITKDNFIKRIENMINNIKNET